MEEAIVVLKNGGYEISGRSFDGNTKFYPIIPIIRDLAERLMRYEPVNGALHHDFGVVCKKCVENLSHCQECGEKRVPLCPVCKAELIPLL